MSSARRSATDRSKTDYDQSTIIKLFRTIRKLFRPSLARNSSNFLRSKAKPSNHNKSSTRDLRPR